MTARLVALALAVALALVGCSGNPPPIDPDDAARLACILAGGQWVEGRCIMPPPPPPPPPDPCDKCTADQQCVDGECRDPDTPWECPLPMPGCHETGQTCSSPGAPCWYNPTADPEVCMVAPDCPQEGCRFPQGLPNDRFTVGPKLGTMGGIVNATMAEMTGCFVGQESCRISVPVDVWFGDVCEALRAKGYCCGRHVDTPPGHDVCPPGAGCTDQISVKASDFCDGRPHEQYRIINPQENAVRWHPSARLFSYAVECDVPPPTGCAPALTGIRRKMNLHCPGDDPRRKWCDHTPGEGDLARCQAIGLGCMPGTGGANRRRCVPRNDCPPQTEGHALRKVCESEFYGWPSGRADPTWSSDGRIVMKKRPDGTLNRAMAYTPNGTWLKVCARDGTCGKVSR